MIATCQTCGTTRETSAEDAGDPRYLCPKCHRRNQDHGGRITVGDFLNPLSADLECDSIPEAMIEAQRRARECPGTAIAVWEEDEPVRVYLRGYELTPIS